MNYKDNILQLIQNNKELYCDDCISELLNIKPRQQVNAICNKLFVTNKIVRDKRCCSNCKKDKLVNIQ
ncbi:hypothetical protein MKX47_20830 [Solibacillus sp. FSL R7-0668]|uniref:hypothetical protein n=1 Tax=Solibacillus sp. FSL R7-0668 TaxID=2921688 RepID=UPI0030FA9857